MNKALENIQMPVANQAAADSASTASRARMQANLGVSSGAAMMGGPALAQKAAATQAQQQGQIAAQQVRSETATQVKVAQTEITNTVQRNKEYEIVQREAFAKKATEQRAKLAEAGRDVKQKLLEEALVFDKTERETKFAQQRQLADFLVQKEVDQQALADYEQAVNAAVQKELIVMSSVAQQLTEAVRYAEQNQHLFKDKAMMDRLKAAQEEASARARSAQRKSGRMQRGIGVAKMAAGAAIIYASGGTATAQGGALIVSGAGDVGAAEQQS